MTSVAAELGRTDAGVLWEDTRGAVVEAFAAGFGYEAVDDAEAAAQASGGHARSS